MSCVPEGRLPVPEVVDVRPGVRVDQDLVAVEPAAAGTGIGGPIHAVGVRLAGADAAHMGVPEVEALVDRGIEDDRAGRLCGLVVGEKEELDRCGHLRVDREIDSVAVHRRPQWLRVTGGYILLGLPHDRYLKSVRAFVSPRLNPSCRYCIRVRRRHARRPPTTPTTRPDSTNTERRLLGDDVLTSYASAAPKLS